MASRERLPKILLLVGSKRIWGSDVSTPARNGTPAAQRFFLYFNF